MLLKSDGTPWRPLVHIEDISRAFLAALEAPRDAVHLLAFNVGRTEENYRIREVADDRRGGRHRQLATFGHGAGPDLRNYRVDCDKITKVLPGFQPQWTVRRGVEELYAAYQEEGLTLEDLTGARFQRIKHILSLQEAGLIDDQLRFTGAREEIAHV